MTPGITLIPFMSITVPRLQHHSSFRAGGQWERPCRPPGLTVVTPDPLYVLGNYNANGSSLNNGTNVANTAPAALIGDAITVLSLVIGRTVGIRARPLSSAHPHRHHCQCSDL